MDTAVIDRPVLQMFEQRPKGSVSAKRGYLGEELSKKNVEE